jgi:hypothetical protein
MKDDVIEADAAFFIKSEAENYEQQIAATKKRLVKYESELDVQRKMVETRRQVMLDDEDKQRAKVEKEQMIITKTAEIQ